MSEARFQVGPLTLSLQGDAAVRALGVASPLRAAPVPEVTLQLEPMAGGWDIPALGWHGDRCSAHGLQLQQAGPVVSGRYSPAKGAVERAIRFALQPALLAHGWLMLHAASVLLPVGVHLLAAPSGTGKSTLARRLGEAGHPVLGDEVALVRGASTLPFPFQPMAPTSDEERPLAAVHLLSQGHEPSSRRLSQAEATSLLLGAAMVYESRPEAVARALEAATAVALSVAVHETRLPDDARATDHLLRLVSGASR